MRWRGREGSDRGQALCCRGIRSGAPSHAVRVQCTYLCGGIAPDWVQVDPGSEYAGGADTKSRPGRSICLPSHSFGIHSQGVVHCTFLNCYVLVSKNQCAWRDDRAIERPEARDGPCSSVCVREVETGPRGWPFSTYLHVSPSHGRLRLYIPLHAHGRGRDRFSGRAVRQSPRFMAVKSNPSQGCRSSSGSSSFFFPPSLSVVSVPSSFWTLTPPRLSWILSPDFRLAPADSGMVSSSSSLS